MENIGKTGEILAGNEGGVLRLHVDTSQPVAFSPENVSASGKSLTFASASGYGEAVTLNIGGEDWPCLVGCFVRLLPRNDAEAAAWRKVAESREGYEAPAASKASKARKRL